MNINQVKRQLSFTEPFNVETKKLRTISENEKILITSIENLSNEIFYEIFDYLDGCDIYDGFSNLNIRFQRLISSSTLLLKIKFSDKSQSGMLDHCKHIIIPNRHRIISFYFSEFSCIDEFFKQCIIDSSFTHLQSVTFTEISLDKLMAILFYLNSLLQFTSLTVYLQYDYFYDLKEVYRMILRLPSLKYSCLLLPEDNELTALIPFAINERFSTIEYLTMIHKCTLNELISILYHTPRLRRLSCGDLFESDNNLDNEISLTLSNLEHIQMAECFLEFNEFENFMKKVCSQLKILNIWRLSHVNYIDPDRWKLLILQYMPQLLKFSVQCLIKNVDDNFKDRYFDKFIEQFISRFWIDHGWIFGLVFNTGEIFYSIKSNRKLWCRVNEKVNMIAHSTQHTSHNLIMCSSPQQLDKASTQFARTIELSIWDRGCVESNVSIIDKLNPMLIAVQINSLYIYFYNTPICIFLKLIHLLPNLDSLRVTCLPSLQLNNLSTEDAESLRLVSNSNKITKLWQSMDFEHLEFLLVLCPRIEYLQVNWIASKDLERLVRFIFMKTNTDILHLNSLDLCVFNTSDEMVNKLHNIIDSEKLLSNYMIKHSDDCIALRWRLS